MELSENLKGDILSTQNQLKIAIQNHQVVLTKMRSDPANVQLKNQLVGVQKHILLLGEKQKQLVQQLRKEIEANSTNSTMTAKSVALSLGLNNNINNNNINNNNNNHTLKCMPVRPSSASSTSSSSTSEDSEDSQRDRQDVVSKCCNSVSSDPDQTAKIQFMSALGLVTKEALAELQNKRVERKRRSTANHTQFVYGSSWDVSKRKKSSYLSSGMPAPPRRSLRVEQPAASDSIETLRIPGLPASLTIERIKAQVCVVCRKSGSQLGVCTSCSTEYHISCAAQCPQCGIKTEADMKEKEAEKEHLVSLSTQLNKDKEDLQKRTSELDKAIAAQEAKRKSLLQAEETTRKKIQTIHNFISIIKTTPQPPS